MADDGVVIKISGDPKDFQKAVEQTRKLFNEIAGSAKEGSEKSSASWASFVGNFSSQAVIGAISAVKDAISAVFAKIGDGVGDALEAEKSVQKFNLALANTGKFTEQSSQDFQNYANTLEKTTNISEEAILQNASLIQSLGNLSSQGLQRATSAAADLSAALGVDFDVASKLVGKASAGNVEALAKFGIQVENTGNKAKDFESALKQIENRFGGSAVASIDTFAGALANAKNSFDDTFKSFGQSIIDTPALKGLAQGVADVFRDLQKTIEDNKEGIKSFVTDGVDFFITGVGVAGKSISIFFDILSGGNIVFTLLQNGISVVIEAVAALGLNVAGIGATITDSLGITDGAFAGLKTQFDNVRAASAEYRDQNLTEAADFKYANDERSASIDAFTTSAQASIRARVDAAAAAGEEENASYLEQRSVKAGIDAESDAQELARIQAFQDSVLAQSEGVLSKSTIEENKSMTDKLIADGKFTEAKRALGKIREANEKESIFTIQKFENLTQKEKLANLKGTFSQIAGLQSSGSKELFAIGKGAAVANATIDGIAAVQKALASAPPPFNFALAGLVGVAQAANLAKIASAAPPSTGMAQGGLVTGGIPGIDSVPILAQQGEIVAPAKSFDQVVAGAAREKGFIQGDENAGMIQALNEISTKLDNIRSVTIQAGTIVADDNGINTLADMLRDAVQFRGASLA